MAVDIEFTNAASLMLHLILLRIEVFSDTYGAAYGFR